MLSPEQLLGLSQGGLLAEVVGYETTEIALGASGTSVKTYSGREYIDFTGGIAVHACGHCHPEIVEAIARQSAEVLHTSDIMRHAPQLELGHRISQLLGDLLPGEDPWSLLLLNSGSESIDAAAKLALKATGRSKFIAFEGAFHGRTMFATALSRSKSVHWSAYEPFLAPLRANILHAPAPRCVNCDGVHVGCCANGVERLLEAHPGEIAALFFEPQQGEGGYFPMAPAAARRIRELTRAHGALLIADEIQSGFGRTGRWFGFEHLGVDPDIVVFGKAVGGGLPLAGFAARSGLMTRWAPGEHGTTFGGNPVSCAAGLAALNVIEREHLIENAAKRGETIRARLRPLIGAHGVTDVRGNGLMVGVELRDASGNPDYAGCEHVKLRARDNGLLLLTCGAKIGSERTDCAAIRIIPPLNVNDLEVERGLDILIGALKRAQKKAA